MNSLQNSIQTHFWAVRDYLSPVLRESKFKEHGRITPEEFVAAGDFLVYKFPTWSWEKGDGSKVRDFLPAEKQYLVSRGVPCLRRVSQMESAAVNEGGETMLSFSKEVGATGDEEDWVATHTNGGAGSSLPPSEAPHIQDIPDVDALPAGVEDDMARQVADMTLHSGGDASGAAAGGGGGNPSDMPDIDDIPDMDDEDLGGGVEEVEDPATAQVQKPKPTSKDKETADNLVQVRTYDCLITYDKYYQTPRFWLIGFDENGTPLKPSQIFEDVSSDYAQKTVTIEPFPHSATISTASVHPCRHASVMKKVIERMNASVLEEQRKEKERRSKDGGGGGGGKKRGWGLGGVVRKATGKDSKEKKAEKEASGPSQEDDPPEGVRVDQYLVIFLKWVATLCPAIEVDSTCSF